MGLYPKAGESSGYTLKTPAFSKQILSGEGVILLSEHFALNDGTLGNRPHKSGVIIVVGVHTVCGRFQMEPKLESMTENVLKIITLSTEDAVKLEQKGVSIGCRGSWSLREQEREPNTEASKLVSLHRRCDELGSFDTRCILDASSPQETSPGTNFLGEAESGSEPLECARRARFLSWSREPELEQGVRIGAGRQYVEKKDCRRWRYCQPAKK